MTNAEWMIKNGYKFDGLFVKRAPETVPYPKHDIQSFTLFCHIDDHIEILAGGETFSTVKDYRIINMWLDTIHIPKRGESE